MVKEITTFREKYPQYSDLDDTTLAGMLANKYPDAYGDLPSKVTAEVQAQSTTPPVTQPVTIPPKDYGLRADGTPKGSGFFGEIQMPTGDVMTEMSIGVNLDGKEMEIPTLVPTLSPQELEHLRQGGEVTKPIVDKAVQHAIGRIKQGLSPFKQEVEPIQQPPTKSTSEYGIPDYLKAAGETALMVGTGAIAEPISGIAGLAKTITSGPEAGAETIKQIQKAMTYAPRAEVTKEMLGKVGETVAPYVTPIVEKYKEVLADPAAEIAGPAAGAAVMTLPTFLMEVGGLKLPRVALKRTINDVLTKTDLSHAYDVTGKLRPEVKQSALASGMTPEDVAELLPETMPKWMAEKTGARIGEIGVLPEAQRVKELERLAREVPVSNEISKAASDLGLERDIPAEQLIESAELLPVTQRLKAAGDSQLATAEKAYIKELDAKSEELIREFGGTTDKGALSTDFELKSTRLVDDIYKQEGDLHSRINKAIPRNTKVEATNTVSALNAKVKELGSKKDLNSRERKLLDRLSEHKITKDTGLVDQYGRPIQEIKEDLPTYARLEQYRQWIGQAMRNNTGPFKDMGEGSLKHLYKQLAKDQMSAAEKAGFGDIYTQANALTVRRKGIEEQLKSVLGSRLDKQVTARGKSAVIGLQEGNVKGFNEFMKNIPSELGPDMRKSIVATAIGDAMVGRAGGLDITKFNNYFTKLQKSPASKRALIKELGKDNFDRLGSLHTLVARVARGKDIPKVDLESIERIGGRLYEAASRIGIYQAVGAVARKAPTAVAGIIGGLLFNAKSVRIKAADQLLASNSFRKMIVDQKTGRLTTQEAVNNTTRRVENLAAYKKWKSTLDEPELAELAAVGLVGYLTGEAIRENE